jgi:hypothetical protein
MPYTLVCFPALQANDILSIGNVMRKDLARRAFITLKPVGADAGHWGNLGTHSPRQGPETSAGAASRLSERALGLKPEDETGRLCLRLAAAKSGLWKGEIVSV